MVSSSNLFLPPPRKDHGYVFLFILFMAGLVGLIEKSGGLKGITLALQRYVKTAKTAQGAAFFAGGKTNDLSSEVGGYDTLVLIESLC